MLLLAVMHTRISSRRPNSDPKSAITIMTRLWLFLLTILQIPLHLLTCYLFTPTELGHP